MRKAFLFMFFLKTVCCNSDDYITVSKNNVTHKFVHFDEPTDAFVKLVFPTWENETFAIFESVKDPQAIAIDIGAWIGTTAIWLSKNFSHVLAIEADRVSLNCLKQNLQASGCFNVSICEKPVAAISEDIIFGPLGADLNESISTIKQAKNHPQDYVIRSETFKRILHDYIYKNDGLKSKKVGFIKCDIEGGEEEILEDLLYFAYHNGTKALVSFHLGWWKNKNIEDFRYIFQFFKTNCPEADVCLYLQKNGFTSLLFEPLQKEEPFVKPNIPIVVPCYNLISCIKNMVAQLEKYTTDIILIDNCSDFEPLLDYYKDEFKYTLLRQPVNYGPHIYRSDFIQHLVGDVFILTDPDLWFNSKLPKDFINELVNISTRLMVPRVGFALCIDADDIRSDLVAYLAQGEGAEFWKNRVAYPWKPDLELYWAAIDTTFCLLNRKFPNWDDLFNKKTIRVAGDFTCYHKPWHKDFYELLQEGEYEAYLKNNNATNFFSKDRRW